MSRKALSMELNRCCGLKKVHNRYREDQKHPKAQINMSSTSANGAGNGQRRESSNVNSGDQPQDSRSLIQRIYDGDAQPMDVDDDDPMDMDDYESPSDPGSPVTYTRRDSDEIRATENGVPDVRNFFQQSPPFRPILLPERYDGAESGWESSDSDLDEDMEEMIQDFGHLYGERTRPSHDLQPGQDLFGNPDAEGYWAANFGPEHPAVQYMESRRHGEHCQCDRCLYERQPTYGSDTDSDAGYPTWEEEYTDADLESEASEDSDDSRYDQDDYDAYENGRIILGDMAGGLLTSRSRIGRDRRGSVQSDIDIPDPSDPGMRIRGLASRNSTPDVSPTSPTVPPRRPHGRSSDESSEWQSYLEAYREL